MLHEAFVDLVVRAWDWSQETNPRKWLAFLVVLLATWIVARVASRITTRRLVRLRRVEPAVVQLLGRLMVFLTVVVALFVYSNVIFKANVAALATTLGLVSLAIGFGLQNTIANIAGGMSLALDRPFRLGDQIRVGDLVGDVQEIGVRSTRILTQRKEYIVIPNKFLESEPITNYTMVYPEFRLDVPVNVAAEADRQHAEELMAEVALAHPVVLRRPPPRVLLRRFMGPILQLELRCWISHPRDRVIVESDLLKSINDRFEAEGIPIPRSPMAPRADGAKKPRAAGFVRSQPAARRLLVPLVATDPSGTRVGYAVALAKALHGQLIGVYLTGSRASHDAAEEGARALHVMESASEEAGIWFKPILRETDETMQSIADTAKDEDVDVVLLGAGRGRSPMEWGWRKEPPPITGDALRAHGLTAIVHEVPADGQLRPKVVAELQAKLDEGAERPREHVPPVVVSPPEPRTSAVPSRPPEEPVADRHEEGEGGEGSAR